MLEFVLLKTTKDFVATWLHQPQVYTSANPKDASGFGATQCKTYKNRIAVKFFTKHISFSLHPNKEFV